MDSVYYGGTIYSIDSENRRYSAIGIEDGKIAFLGTDAEAQRMEAARRVDLQGATVLPGFIDSHMHMLSYAQVAGAYLMDGVGSVAEAVAGGRRHAERMDQNGDGGWLYGRGWNQEQFADEPRMLTRQDLDKISTRRPILLVRTCGHAAAVNSKALEIVLARPEAKDYPGQIDAEKGILTEGAVSLCSDAMGAPTAGQMQDMILLAQRDLNAKGITSVDSGNFLALPEQAWREVARAFEEMEAQGKLTVRVREEASFNTFENLKDFIDSGRRTGQGGDFYRIGAVKLFQDGSLGASTALMHQPYEGDPENRGVMIHTAGDLQNCVDYAYSHDMQILTHAIGDAACDMVCDAYGAAIEKYGKRDARLAINHVQVVSPGLFGRMKKLGILAFIQPVFVLTDQVVVEKLVGKERARLAYAWKSMLDAGLVCCGGSDAPVESFDVLANIQAAVTRARPGGASWHPQECLSVLEAVKLFTINGAYGAFEEDRKGSLELGKLADLVVLGADPFEAAPEDIAKIPVLRTVVGGAEVYTA